MVPKRTYQTTNYQPDYNFLKYEKLFFNRLQRKNSVAIFFSGEKRTKILPGALDNYSSLANIEAQNI